MPMRRAAVDSARIVDYTIRDEDVGVGFREAHRVVSDKRPADYITDGVNDNVEIQAAIADLTAGRTWYEKVLLKGNFVIGETIKIPDYTALQLIGKIRLKDGFGDYLPMFQNEDPTEGNDHILIEGPGVLDGNRAANPTGNIGILLSGSSGIKRPEFITIRDLTFRELSHNAIRAVWPRNMIVDGCRAFAISTHAFYYHYAFMSVMDKCYVDSCGLDGFAFSGCANTAGSNLVIRVAGRNALSFDHAEDCVFDHILVEESIAGSFFSTKAYRCTISNSLIRKSRRCAVHLSLSDGNQHHNRFVNCSFYNLNTDLIAEEPAVKLNANVAGREFLGVEFINCKCIAPNCDYFIKEILTAGSISKTRAIGCDIVDIGTAPFLWVAPDSYAINCPGYNPVGYLSPDPTWGASPWTYTNEDHVPEDIYISVATAGDVSSITKDGQNLPLPGTEPTYICHLEPGESIIITYTTAGTLKRFGW